MQQMKARDTLVTHCMAEESLRSSICLVQQNELLVLLDTWCRPSLSYYVICLVDFVCLVEISLDEWKSTQ